MPARLRGRPGRCRDLAGDVVEQQLPHEVSLRAAEPGIEVRAGDRSPVRIAADELWFLRVQPGTALRIVPRGQDLVFFREANGVSWAVDSLIGVAPPGENVRLPAASAGATGSSSASRGRA